MTDTETGYDSEKLASPTEPPPSTPFAQLDNLPAPMRSMLLNALEDMAATQEIGRVRELADSMLGASIGERILDAGCGVGEVARELAAEVGPDGQVTAVDVSQVTIDHAESKDGGAGILYRVADLTALPFPDGSFDAVRTERVLQHLKDPDLAVAELARVTRPGGRVCLIDTDWTSLAIDGMPEHLVQTIRRAFLDRDLIHHGTMGRTLRRRLVQAGLTDVSARPITMCFPDPVSAAVILPMFNPEIPREVQLFPDEVRAPWFEAVSAAGARNEFLAALTMWVAVGFRS
jgi:SAM-dependent methyltransferase